MRRCSFSRSFVPIISAALFAGSAGAGWADEGLASGGGDPGAFSLGLPSMDLGAGEVYGMTSASSALLPAPALLGDLELEDRTFGCDFGIGFTADPGTFLLGFEADFFVTQNVFIGPLVQVGVADKHVIVAPTLNFGAMFDLPYEGLASLKPFLEAGIGFAYIHEDQHGGHTDDDVGLLVNLGFGLFWFFTDDFAVGSRMLFNIMPAEVVDDHFFYTWEVVTFRFQF